MLNNTGIWVIIPNWNGGELTLKCLKSLQAQTAEHSVIVVDNASEDNSVELINKSFANVQIVQNDKNLGFAGGVNAGIKEALKNGATYIALLNNDVVLEKDWLHQLQKSFKNKKIAAVTGKLLDKNGEKIDNTGDEYSVWGLTIARQRGLPTSEAISEEGEVFGACAGAAMYRAEALKDAGMFDEKFFAYYEDTDLNFRLQLRGWKTIYQPKAVAYHATGSTSSRISGFTTLQTLKNLPIIFRKNVPLGLLPRIAPRFFMAYWAIFFSSIFRGQGVPALKGFLLNVAYIPHCLAQRRQVQKSKKVNGDYIWSVLYQDLPPNANRLRKLHSFFTLGRR